MFGNHYKKVGDSYHLLTNGKLFDEKTSTVRDGVFGLRCEGLDEYLKRGQGTKYCQFIRIVLPELENARHIFRGLRRGLFNDDNANADQENLIYTWKPNFDVEWEGGKLGKAVDRPPPGDAVFAVIASPNVRHKDKYPEIDCFIGAWNWLAEDAVLAEAPVEWVDRYDCKLWTRSDK